MAVTHYDRLKRITGDERLLDVLLRAFTFARKARNTVFIDQAAEYIAENWDVKCTVHGTSILMIPVGTRAKQPCCALASYPGGSSPSATCVFSSPAYMLQLFEADADDTDMVHTRHSDTDRVVAQGRVLLV